MLNIGILHPGFSGVGVVDAIKHTEHAFYWVSQGRSNASRKRALDHGLNDAYTMENLARICDIIICVCPPVYAEQVADEVLSKAYEGIYLDANPISFELNQSLLKRFDLNGACYIDGGLLHRTDGSQGFQLVLSGSKASVISVLFESSQTIDAYIISDKVGDASMLKLLQSAHNKSYSALLISTWSLADELGLRESFEHLMGVDNNRHLNFCRRRIGTAASKAWRFSGEMDMLRDQTAPSTVSKFFEASTEVFQSLEGLKDQAVSVDEVIEMYRAKRA